MSSAVRTRSLVSRTRNDPWSAVVGRRPHSYQIPEVGNKLIELIDQALFERQFDVVSDNVSVLKRWARQSPIFKPKALAAEGAFFVVCGKLSIAEQKMFEAKQLAGEQDDPLAECYRRLAVLHIYQSRFSRAIQTCNTSIYHFEREHNNLGVAISLITRGYVKWKTKQYRSALQDQEDGLGLLDNTMPFFHFVIASVNVAGILMAMGKSQQALERIEEIQSMTNGQPNMQRPRLNLRWIRALLLEQEGKHKNAYETLDRVDRRMVKLHMDGERRVLLADYARIARSDDKVRRLAEKARAIELSREVLEKIDQVLRRPSADNVRRWRESLDSYMPVFSRAA